MAEEIDKDVPLSNLQRLFSHLKEGSLAARLVQAQMKAGAMEGQEALKKVVRDRLDEIRRQNAGTADKKD